jgi:hypothetical protein
MALLTIAGTLALLLTVVKLGDSRWRTQMNASHEAQAAD